MSRQVPSSPAKSPRPKILIVAAHDSLGGAARAITRVFRSLEQFHSEEFEVLLRVSNQTIQDPGVIGGKPKRSRLEYLEYFLRTRFRKFFPRKEFISENKLLHSQALYQTGLGREINSLGPDLVLFGWLGNATISIEEIGRIRAPKMFRLSDMWVFSGAEHYTDQQRYAASYSTKSRPKSESGPDINRETFLRKIKSWREPSTLIALSRWQEEEAHQSSLTREWPSTVIPVPVDHEFWKPQIKDQARAKFGLNGDANVVMFGAGAGIKHHHKGADLLFEAIPQVKKKLSVSSSAPLELAIFGQESGPQDIHGVPARYLGRLDDEGLRMAYSAADVFVVPSRLEALGQVAAEAQACATPVVAFDNSGLADVIEDSVTGRLVPAFDTGALADAIVWTLEEPERRGNLGIEARRRAIRLWAPRVVARQYAAVFTEILASEASKKRRMSKKAGPRR